MIYLVCGVPGSGKTWVCEQLTHKFHYIPHDLHSHKKLVHLASQMNDRYIVMDCPFAERKLRDLLEDADIIVKPIFIVEEPDVIKSRYLKRNGYMPTPGILTRANTIMEKVREWDAYYGTSKEVLAYLKKI